MTWDWAPRAEPLEAVAVVGFDDVRHQLATAASVRPEGLRAAYGPTHLLLLGAAETLPWADGAIYLGRDGGVLLPTALAPHMHPDLICQAVTQAYGPGNYAVTDTRIVTYRSSAGTVSRRWLEAYTVSDAFTGFGE